MTKYEPKLKRGDVVRIPHVTPGHDRHTPNQSFRVNRVFPGADAPSTTYNLDGSNSMWPETRLRKLL